MKKRLTDRFLQSVKPPGSGRDVYTDTEAPGLEIRISPNGRKAWPIRYRLKGKERQRSSYSVYPMISLHQARARAKDIGAAAAHGVDLPEQEKRGRENDDKAASRPSTLAALLDEYVENYCRPSQRQWKLVERMFENHVKPAIGNRPLSELRRADLVELLDDIQNNKKMGAQVNRVRSHLMHALNWAVEHEYLEANPFAAVKRRKLEKRRERVLNDRELRAIWHAADRLTEPSREFVKALILSGQRRDEVRCMSWSEINFDRALWTIPGRRTKSKRTHEVPLAPAILTVIGDRQREGDPVFTIDGKKPYAGQGWLKVILDRESGVTDWVFHDFRRTCASGLAALGFSQDIIDRVLNHAKPGLANTYNVHQYLDEKRSALAAWAEHVRLLVGDEPKVVVLPTRR
jgi:integrase